MDCHHIYIIFLTDTLSHCRPYNYLRLDFHVLNPTTNGEPPQSNVKCANNPDASRRQLGTKEEYNLNDCFFPSQAFVGPVNYDSPLAQSNYRGTLSSTPQGLVEPSYCLSGV